MPPPVRTPLGLDLTRTSKLVSRAFDEALTQVGGSLPTWVILTTLKARKHGKQQDIADAVGIEGATLTHHLNRLERDGLITRTRDPQNRRVHQVALTDAGEQAFFNMLGSVQAFDRRLRAGFSDGEVAALTSALERLRTNITTTESTPEEGRTS